MKKTLLYLLLFSSFCGFTQNSKAFFAYSRFQVPGEQPYIETYLSFIGNSLNFIKKNKGYVSEVEVSIAFTRNDSILAGNKYILSSPVSTDTSKLKPNFIDVQRYSIPAGAYQLELSIRDVNSSDTSLSFVEIINIESINDSLIISDIQMLESFTKSNEKTVLSKSGYDLIPYVSNFYPENMKTLGFYVEIYNSEKAFGKQEKFLVNYFIEDFETKKPLEEHYRYSKEEAGMVNVILSAFDLDSLESGNYNVVVEVKDKTNKLLASKRYFFQRSAPSLDAKQPENPYMANIANTFIEPYTNIDTLKEFIKCLRPISTQSEIVFGRNQMNSNDSLKMQQYLLGFWTKRNEVDPGKEFQHYMNEVAKAEKWFSTQIKKGYETERGRVYLEYGPPDSRSKFYNEPNSYPYEIWHYEKAKAQTNRRFVFYNKDLITNDFSMIFSDARGETSNPRWRMMLKSRTVQVLDPDQENTDNGYGGNVDDFFDNPR